MADRCQFTSVNRLVTSWPLLMKVTIFYWVFVEPQTLLASKLPLNARQEYKLAYRIFYQRGNSEKNLPECSRFEVCNRVDTYSTPWIERQCRCSGKQSCSLSTKLNDDHTVLDKSTQFKLCEPVSKLPTCRYFRDVTWTYVNHPDNTTQQILHCVCPRNSVAYILNHQAYYTLAGVGYRYTFACSPQSWQRCQRKEPCRLFTVKKRPGVEQVNFSRLCECPLGFVCPKRYAEPSVMVDTIGNGDHTRTYSAYCGPAAD
ncbi:protein giant-lens-like [Tachypleus tridentatus]|uniref:protein giant-lens-like n=1 Tax=Tachypleus tridentatus TaxID=6853 RepID=UPI003FD41AB0